MSINRNNLSLSQEHSAPRKTVMVARLGRILITLFLAGCTSGSNPISSLAIMDIVRQDGQVDIVYLPNDYGFLITSIDDNKTEYYLYNKPRHTISMTSDFGIFMAGLSAFPDAVRVDWLYGCAISSFGMTDSQRASLQNLITKKAFLITDDNEGNWPICTCETIEIHQYTAANNAINRMCGTSRTKGGPQR